MQPEGVAPSWPLERDTYAETWISDPEFYVFYVSSTHEFSLTDRCFKPVIVSYIYI